MAFRDSALDAKVALSFGSVGDEFRQRRDGSVLVDLKRELAYIHRRRRWTSRAKLRAALFDHVEAFYNRA